MFFCPVGVDVADQLFETDSATNIRKLIAFIFKIY